MSENTREEITAKIKAKNDAVEKKLSKPKNLITQRETYVNSIADHQAKIEKLEALINRIDESTAGIASEVSLRQSEVEHMEEILSRFDRGEKELVECAKTMVSITERYEKIAQADIDNWKPGQESIGALAKKDPEYAKLESRKKYLTKMLDACLTDVRRIYVSRGTVSDFNTKGRKGV